MNVTFPTHADKCCLLRLVMFAEIYRNPENIWLHNIKLCTTRASTNSSELRRTEASSVGRQVLLYGEQTQATAECNRYACCCFVERFRNIFWGKCTVVCK